MAFRINFQDTKLWNKINLSFILESSIYSYITLVNCLGFLF